MNAFDPIPLNTNWQIDGTDGLLNLADWPRHFLSVDETIEMRRVFDLEPIGEVCLRFFLHIDAAPDETTVHMNSWDVGGVGGGQGLVVDVTDYVTLEANVLLLTVSQPGEIGKLWLERVPCETV